MSNQQLLEMIGMIDDDLILQADKQISQKYNHGTKWYKIAAAACIIGICALLYQIPAVKAAIEPIIEAVQQLTNNYNDKSLDLYKVNIKQSQSLDGITMTVNDVVVETEKLIVQCNFEYEDAEKKMDLVMPRDWPFCIKLEEAGKEIFHTENADDIMTIAYQKEDGSIEDIFTVDLRKLKDVSVLLDKNIAMTFYYNHGVLKGQGYTFQFTPKNVYEEKTYTVKKTYEVDSYGSFTVEKITQEALYVDFQINNKLQCSENEEIDFKFVDENGKEYYQERKYNNYDYWFARPEDFNQKFYLKVVLIQFNEGGVGTEKEIGKYPISW